MNPIVIVFQLAATGEQCSIQSMCAEFTPGSSLSFEKLLHAAGVMLQILRLESQTRVYPRGLAPVVLPSTQEGLSVADAEFSLIPSWWKPTTGASPTSTRAPRPPFATHNARLETIATKPAFRDSFRKRHCIVPIDCFYESSLFGDQFAGHRIRVQSTESLYAAACTSEWVDPTTGELILSFTIITSRPTHKLFAAGHDRMPIFLNISGAQEWLTNQNSESQKLFAFLQKNSVNRELPLQISIDRVLKDGWQKKAPSQDELTILAKQIDQSEPSSR